jgi:hypothetical protein
VFPLKILGNYIRFALATPEVAPDLAHQLHLIAGSRSSPGEKLALFMDKT